MTAVFLLMTLIFVGLAGTNFVCLQWAPRAWQRGLHIILGMMSIAGVLVSFIALLNQSH